MAHSVLSAEIIVIKDVVEDWDVSEASPSTAVGDIVSFQLRYDNARANAIRYLYGLSDSRLPLEASLDALRGSATIATPAEVHYPLTEPDALGKCRYCGFLTYSTVTATRDLTDTLFGPWDTWNCRWGSCNSLYYKGADGPSQMATHVSNHVRRGSLHCGWDSCTHVVEDFGDLEHHLRDQHGIYTNGTLPDYPKFCFECGSWEHSQLAWKAHSQDHMENPSPVYGPVNFNGVLAASARCPYCIKNRIYKHSLEGDHFYLKHIMLHISEEEARKVDKLDCPHPLCASFEDTEALIKHLEGVHSIPLSKLDNCSK
ncbi:hypothetical protein PSPO01_00626 [Paraphaeosphaeria sporulosa]